jgi:hypothetical protein
MTFEIGKWYVNTRMHDPPIYILGMDQYEIFYNILGKEGVYVSFRWVQSIIHKELSDEEALIYKMAL